MIKLLFSVGPYSNLEIEGIESIDQAKAAYDKCIALFGEPKEKEPSYKGKQGNYQKKEEVPRELQRGASSNQVKQVGYPCDWCQTPLKASKKGNPYCSCWFEADPNKAPQGNFNEGGDMPF